MESEQIQQQVQDIVEEPQVNPDGFFSELTNQNACSVRVAVRVRPLVGRELYENQQKTCVDVDEGSNKIAIGERNFQFDRVFPLDSEQQDIFEVCGRNLVLGCFAGYNATILAYGQTGSGKTHTMGTGSTNGLQEKHIGLVPRVFQFIFDELERRKKLSSFSEFTIRVSFLELYNEELHDLLDPTTGKPTKDLQIKEKNGSIYVQGLKEEPVMSKEECLLWLNKGIAHRTTSATLMNEGSSRSHAIFTITIEQRIVKEIEIPTEVLEEEGNEQSPAAGQQEEFITAKFHFVDLAGSERIKRTGATGQLLKEGISINKGLLCLGNVISALTEETKRSVHIPYRDSKLTRILQDSLGGNSRTTMIACVSPAESNYEETINSIKYASRARNIKNKPVINRDPNSMLIDSLRTQITTLQGEIKEYQDLLKQNNIEIPESFANAVQQRVENQKKNTPIKKPTLLPQDSVHGTINFQEMRDVKIKLSRKEKELKDLQEQLDQVLQKVIFKDEEISQLQKERDALRLKNEILNECIQQNNLQVDGSLGDSNGSTLSLIDEYKSKIQNLQNEMEKKEKELQDRGKKIAELQLQSQREEELLRKHLEENQRLKRQLKKMEENNTNMLNNSPPASTRHSNNTKLRLNLQAINNQQAKKSKDINNTQPKRKSQLDDLKIPDLNEKFINNLTNQLESLFTTAPDDEALNSARSTKGNADDPLRLNSVENIVNSALQDSQNLLEEENAIQLPSIEEKEKILETVKNSAKQMQTELMELMKNEYEKRIQEIEKEKTRLDNERQDTLKKVSSNDSKQAQVIDQQYKQRMEDLTKQLSQLKEKEKKQDVIEKQYQVKVQKMKALEEDIQKMKKREEDMEKKRKNESEKFSKFKQSIQKELTLAKKTVNEKEKEVQKLKIDLKKIDQFAQKKLSELKGFQKKVMEERMKKEQEQQKEYESKGIDIDRIKTWITENTQRMLNHRELKEQFEELVAKKEQIEDDMLAEEEKLSSLMVQKERIELECQQLQLEDEPDEGRIMELEEEIYQKTMEIQNITDTLDSLDETLTFVNGKINRLSEELIALDIDTIQPLNFSGLQSVDTAKVTLQTFFGILLDLNIYNRDLEVKCIEQDEAILGLNEKIGLLQSRVEELMQNSGQKLELQVNQEQNRINNLGKDKAIKNIVESLDGFVEFQDVKNLNLTANEQNSLTKLSLSKIVSNLKQKLREEETKNHNLSNKLEQALNDKESYKLRYDNLRNKVRNEKILKEPLQFKEQQQQEQEKKVPSLAAARERKRRGQNHSSAQMTLDTTQDLDITMISKTSGGTSNLHLKYKSKMQQSRPGTSMDETHKSRNHDRSNMSSQLSFRQSTNHQPQRSMGNGLTDYTEREQPNTAEKRSYLKRRLPAKKVESMRLSKDQSQDLQTQIQNNFMEKKQLMPIQEYNTQTPKQVPNFRERRNKKKLENNDEADKVEPEKVLEIEKIKEEAMLIAQAQTSQERRQSRMRAYSKRGFSKNKQKFQANLYQQFQDTDLNDESMIQSSDNLSNVKELQDSKRPDSPKIISPKKCPQFVQPQIEINSNSESDMNESVISPSKDIRNKWTYEELAQVENHGARLVGANYADDKIILVFEDFTIRELSIQTLEEINQLNLLKANQMNETAEKVVDFAIDRELNAIAIASPSTVYVFDYQDKYQILTKVEAESIIQVLFCNYNIVILVYMEDVAYVVTYQIDEEPIEIGSYQIQHQGYQTMIKTDNQFVYFTSGIRLGKLVLPEMNPQYVIETEHSDVIINFNVSKYAAITTSKDGSLRCHDIETGEQNMEQVNDIRCDYLESQHDFIITRCGEATAYLIWKYSPLKTELELIDEIAIDLPEFEVQDFKMTGNIAAQFNNGVKYDLILVVTCVTEGFLVNALKHKPLSEY